MSKLIPFHFVNEITFAFIYSATFILILILFYELSSRFFFHGRNNYFMVLHSLIKIRLQSACSHGVVGVCALCIQAQQAKIGACTHNWSAFSDHTFVGVACDFNLPAHVAASHSHAIVHYCTVCHAVVCNNCFTG